MIMTKNERVSLCLAALKHKKGEFRLAVDIEAPMYLQLRLMEELQVLKICLETEVERAEDAHEEEKAS